MFEAQVLHSRVIMLVDLDYFFAQCEERRNPSIKDKPVVVCVYSGRSEDSGAVATANYLARDYGVKSGMPIVLAKKKLEGIEAAFLPVDFEFYEQVSEKIMTILRGYAESFEQVGIDEAFLDVSSSTSGDLQKAVELAQKMKNAVLMQEKLTCSIGVGPNKLVAKIAADMQKPDGLTVVQAEKVQGFLFSLPVDRLIGVGPKTRERMQTLNIGTIEELAKFDVQILVEVFGKSLGVYFHNAALGVDDEPVREKGKVDSVSRISTLREDTRDLKTIIEKTDGLCDEIHAVIMQRGFSFKSVGIIVVRTDMSIRSRSKTLENPAYDVDVLRKSVKELFERFLEQSELKARRVGVRVSGFVEQKKQRTLADFVA